jgi:hypothetical protein
MTFRATPLELEWGVGKFLHVKYPGVPAKHRVLLGKPALLKECESMPGHTVSIFKRPRF